MRSAHAMVALGAALLLAPASARANPVDQIGFGSRGTALANALVADLDGLYAPVYNAAAGAHGESIELGAGYSFGRPVLELNGRDPRLSDIRGFWGAIAAPFTLGRAHLSANLALSLPDQFVARVKSVPGTEPRVIMWDNRPHRIVVLATASARLGDYVSIGVGASIFGSIGGPGASFTIEALPGQTVAEADIDVDLGLSASPVAGVLVTPRDGVRIGIRYVEESALDVSIPIDAEVAVPGTSLAGPVVLDFRGKNYFVPREITLGGAVDLGHGTLMAELSFQQWSALDQITATVALDLDLGVEIPLRLFEAPAPHFDDVWLPRVAYEHRFELRNATTLAVRGGYWFVRDPVPPQRGITSYVNSDRHVLTAGGGYTFAVREMEVTAELFGQVHLHPEMRVRKLDPAAPGGDLTFRGQVFFLGAGLRLAL